MKRNKIERLKHRLSPYAFSTLLGQIDLADLNEEERFYLKNYGIYNSKLEPQRFMVRIRVAGGRIERARLGLIVQIAKTYGASLLLTARAQIELHGLHAGNVLEVWQMLQDAGITTMQTLTDNFRNIVTDPYDGADSSSKIETYPLILKMQAFFLGQPEWMGMIPRKFNTAICATAETHSHFFSNDLFFGLASKEHRWGFNLYLGGKNSEAAKSADLFVEAEQVPEMFKAVAKAYRTYGLRGTRSKTRLFHLIDQIGMEKFVTHILEFYPHKRERSGTFEVKKAPIAAYRALQNERYGYCVQSYFGKIETGYLEEVLAFAEQKDLEIRLGIDQNLYLLGLQEPHVPFRRIAGASQVTACAGSSYCPLSLWDIKQETRYLPLDLIDRYGIEVGFSGCLKGCGRHHHADIGLVGLRTNVYGETQKAARVFLGAEYSTGNAVARLVFPVVPLNALNALLRVIIREFEQSGVEDFETFSREYLNHFSSDFLYLWFLAKLRFGFDLPLEKVSEKTLYTKLRSIDGFPLVEEDERYIQSSRILMHALWDDRD
ncbi:MAG: nitrite/sulfite reductase [Sulfurovum sp.]|nr:MAG: nitrite/sulfite reductase [Sulfurovum sp.]